MDENLPAEWDQFFSNGGELPATLQALHTPEAVVADPVVADPVVADPVVAEPVVATPAPVVHTDPALQGQVAALTKQLADLQAALTKKPEEVVPDAATDPLGHLMYQQKQIQAQIEAIRTGTQQQQEETSQQTQFNTFITNVNSQVAAFKTTHADYDDAYKHLVDVRVADFTDRGYTPQVAREMVSREEMDIAGKALQAGKNPAEVAYGMAKRYGYAVKAAPTPAENKLDTIKKGLETGKEVERTAPPSQLTLANLKEASDKDLDKMVQENWEGIFGKSKGIFG